jgi:isopenicillin N synthase-like dioxygenase
MKGGAFQSIPIVDIHRAVIYNTDDSEANEREELAKKLVHVLHTVGFAVITHHGVATISEIFDTSANFFALPLSEKDAIAKHKSPHFRGWEPVGAESTNGRADWREQIDIWSEHAPDDAIGEEKGDQKRYNRLLGPNQWPSIDFHDKLQKWQKEM